MSQLEVRIIPNMRATTFGATEGARGKVWSIDPSTGRWSSRPEHQFTRNRLAENHWLPGTALPINPSINPELQPEQVLIAYNGRLEEMPVIDTGPWWGLRRSDAYWLRGPTGGRPHAETASKLWHSIASGDHALLKLVPNGGDLIQIVRTRMTERDLFTGALRDRLDEALRKIREQFAMQIVAEDLLDDQNRIPAQIPHSVGLDLTPGGWRLLGVNYPRPEDYERFSANVDAAVFVVRKPGGIFASIV